MNRQQGLLQRCLELRQEEHGNLLPTILGKCSITTGKNGALFTTGALSAAKTNPEGSYATAQEMEEQGVRKGETLLEDGTAFTLGKAGNAVRKPLTCERKPNGCPPQNEVHDEPYPFEGMHSPTVICIVQRIRAGTLWIVRDNGPRPKVAAQ